MEVQFQCTLADYTEAQLAHVRGSAGYYVLLILGCLAVLLGSYEAYAVDFWRGVVIQFLGLFWLSFIPIRRLWLRRDFRKHPNFSIPQVLTLKDEGLHGTSAVGEGTAKWTAFSKLRETPNLFMLYMGARMFRVIPKRAIPPSQLEEVRTFLRSKLPTK